MTPARQPQQEIHDQIGKLKTDLFKCIGTIESIQSKCRDTHTSPPAPVVVETADECIRITTFLTEKGKESIRKAAREKVLEQVIDYCKKEAKENPDDEAWYDSTMEKVADYCEFLRAHQQGGVSE